MKNFFIIANNSKEESIRLQAELEEYIATRGGSCAHANGCNRREDGGYTDPKTVPAETEAVIVLGGDGTLLQASCDLGDLELPFLGINAGTLGFLASVEPSEAFDAVDRLLASDFHVEERMMVSGSVQAGGEIRKAYALNEIVITGDRAMQLVSLSVYVNGLLLHRYFGDGVIVATPTGSTGYNLSAGGPIVNPTARTMILTPVSPHSIHNRSIVFAPEDEIRIVVDEGRYGQAQTVVAVFDGSHRKELKSGDAIEICKAAKSTKTIKLNEESFFVTLQDKLKD